MLFFQMFIPYSLINSTDLEMFLAQYKMQELLYEIAWCMVRQIRCENSEKKNILMLLGKANSENNYESSNVN